MIKQAVVSCVSKKYVDSKPVELVTFTFTGCTGANDVLTIVSDYGWELGDSVEVTFKHDNE